MAKLDKPERQPMRIRRIVMACVRGQRLTKTIRSRPGLIEADPLYTLEPAGRVVAYLSAIDAIASGLLAPNNDGLLGPESSQTWTAAPGAEERCSL